MRIAFSCMSERLERLTDSRSIVVTFGSLPKTVGSLAFNVRGLDDRPPPRDLFLLIVGKSLRRLLLKGRYLLPDLGKSLQGSLIGQYRSDGCIQPGGHVGGNTAWRPDRMPVEEVESAQASIVDGRNFGRRSEAGGRCHGESFDRPLANLRHGVRGQIEKDIDVASHKVQH